ncbi:RNA exonuclease-like protein [Elsinoe fawcettii]|nr:RNA exonuclease-like protein [Elsinoe fawcettii]
MPGIELSSNWKKLQSSLSHKNDTKKSESTSGTLKRKRPSTAPKKTAPSKRPKMSAAETPTAVVDMTSEHTDVPSLDISAMPPPSSLNCGSTTSPAGRYLALDCEMVSTQLHSHSLARVSITNYHHAILYDSFVLPHPADPVTDYRTHVSGVTPHLLRKGFARPLEEVRAAVAELLRGRVLVGHALSNDLKVLGLDHPGYAIRDTARYKGYRTYAGGRTPGLKTLAREVLEIRVQEGRHDSIVDSRVAMELFRREKGGMESEVRKRYGGLVQRVGKEIVKGKVGMKQEKVEVERVESVAEEANDEDEVGSALDGSELLDGESEEEDTESDGEEQEDKSEAPQVAKKKRKKRRKHKSRTTRV